MIPSVKLGIPCPGCGTFIEPPSPWSSPAACRMCDDDYGPSFFDAGVLVWNVWIVVMLAAAEKQGRRISNYHQKDVRRLGDIIERVEKKLDSTRALAAMVDQLEDDRRRLNARAEAFYESMCADRRDRKSGAW